MLTRHMRTRTALTGVLAATALAVAGAAADAATSAQRLRIPDHATLRIAGHGYGHGYGLSQYGAEGAARQGKSARFIVGFYYPHTKAGHAGGDVKVLISADTDDDTTVVNRSGLEVHDFGSGKTTALPSRGTAGKASQWRLAPARGGKTKVSYRNGGWHVWRKLSGDGEFRASKPLTLVLGSDRVAYRGSLQSRTPAGAPSSHRATVNKVSLEDYVQGVVPREMPALWHQAALRAQAIAARTYAASERSSTNPRWDLCDTSSCQVYGGKSAEYPTSNKAVAKTAGQVRMFHGAPAFTQFGSSNGGWTSDGGKAYLPAQKDPYDGWSGNPNHSWTTKVTAATVEKAFGLGNLTSISITERDGHGQWNGRVLHMKLVGSKRTATIDGDDFRSALGLRSTWFDISV